MHLGNIVIRVGDISKLNDVQYIEGGCHISYGELINNRFWKIIR